MEVSYQTLNEMEVIFDEAAEITLMMSELAAICEKYDALCCKSADTSDGMHAEAERAVTQDAMKELLHNIELKAHDLEDTALVKNSANSMITSFMDSFRGGKWTHTSIALNYTWTICNSIDKIPKFACDLAVFTNSVTYDSISEIDQFAECINKYERQHNEVTMDIDKADTESGSWDENDDNGYQTASEPSGRMSPIDLEEAEMPDADAEEAAPDQFECLICVKMFTTKGELITHLQAEPFCFDWTLISPLCCWLENSSEINDKIWSPKDYHPEKGYEAIELRKHFFEVKMDPWTWTTYEAYDVICKFKNWKLICKRYRITAPISSTGYIIYIS